MGFTRFGSASYDDQACQNYRPTSRASMSYGISRLSTQYLVEIFDFFFRVLPLANHTRNASGLETLIDI